MVLCILLGVMAKGKARESCSDQHLCLGLAVAGERKRKKEEEQMMSSTERQNGNLKFRRPMVESQRQLVAFLCK